MVQVHHPCPALSFRITHLGVGEGREWTFMGRGRSRVGAGAVLQLGMRAGRRQVPWAQEQGPRHGLGVRDLVLIPWSSSSQGAGEADGPNDLRFRENLFHHTLMFEEQGVCECRVMY